MERVFGQQRRNRCSVDWATASRPAAGAAAEWMEYSFQFGAIQFIMGGDLGYDIEFSIPSLTSEGHRIEDIVVEHLRNGGFTEKEIFGIKLAVEEALVNAIKHGNQLDPEKKVQIGFSVNEQGFAIEIRDQGPGFNMEDVPDPTDPENLERPTGRGLFLMHAYMTECNFIPPGNICRMKRVR